MIEKMKKKVVQRRVFKPHYSQANPKACSYEIQLDLFYPDSFRSLMSAFTYYKHPKSMKVCCDDQIIDLHKDKYNNLILRIYEVS